jgi:hypothetical protein
MHPRPNPSIERTYHGRLHLLGHAAHVEEYDFSRSKRGRRPFVSSIIGAVEPIR